MFPPCAALLVRGGGWSFPCIKFESDWPECRCNTSSPCANPKSRFLATLGMTKSRSYGSRAGAVAFFVFFAGATGAGVVATYLCAGTDGFGRFGLRGASLILQLFLLTFLLAFHFARESGKALRRWFAGAGCSAGDGGSGTLTDWRRWRRLVRSARSTLGGLLVLLDLNVEQIADGFVIDARHHIFEQDEGFFFELDEGIFLAVAAETDAFFQMVERKQVVFPLRINDIENDAAFEPAH